MTSALHPFLFERLPVRGRLVQLTGVWQEILQRRADNSVTGAYPPPVAALLGELAAAAVLLQSSIRFDGALVLQIFGDGPVKLAVVEVQPDLRLRATASVIGTVADDASLSQMVNLSGRGRCAVTLDPSQRKPGQPPYQGVVSLLGPDQQPFEQVNQVLASYMLQSEQLDTTLVLAADRQTAAGMLVQRIPTSGQLNLAGTAAQAQDPWGENPDYQRIAMLTASLKRDELLHLDADTVLRRLYWQEPLLRHASLQPRFACSCSRERVSRMILGLGLEEADSLLAERGEIEVGCDFCGRQYRFDAIDAHHLFADTERQAPGSSRLQ